MLDANEHYKKVIINFKELKLIKNKMLNQVEQKIHLML